VFKGTGDTYVILGEAKIEEAGGNRQVAAAQSLGSEEPQEAIPAPQAAVSSVGEEDEDATGLSEDDINLVVAQGGVTRGRAIAALKKNDNDVVNAIMSLTA